MAVTAHVFPQFAQGLAEKQFNLQSDTINVGLSNVAGPVTLATSGVQAAQTWANWKANVAAEISGTGYTAGGLALTGVTATTTGDVLTLTATSPAWSGASFTANQAVFYDATASTFQLLCFWDLGGAVTVTAGTFTLSINASGLLTATAS